jgi:hypothetical protein
MLMFSNESLKGAKTGKLKVIKAMLEHVLPEIARADKTSAHILQMLMLALKEKIDEVEQTKH